MTAKPFFTLAAVVAASVLGGSTALAQANTPTVARSYTVTPKPGMVAQFEVALREHARWRAENGDPWDWNVSQLETGENLGTYFIRSGGHSWADFDAYDAGFAQQGLVHWNATVAPLVESLSSAIGTTDQELSKPPPEGTAYAFVNITRFYLRPGRGQEFNRLHTQATRRLDVDTKWMPKFGVRAAKDTLQVKDFHARENQSEKRNAEIRIPALKFAKKLFD